jgi:polyphosphate kinase 2 (PPK2 family)
MMHLKDFEDSPTLEKSAYDMVEKDLQERLYILFSEASKQKLATILILEGWAGSGKGDLLKSITTRLDPRKLRVYSLENSDAKPKTHHFLYDYWQKLPLYGENAIFDGSWYSRVSYEKQEKLINKREYKDAFKSILNFEETLHNDQYVILKYFLNISSKEQKRRFKKASEEGKKWMVSESDWKQFENYKDFERLFEEYLNKTDTEICPWSIISAKNKYYCRISVIESIIRTLEEKLRIDSRQMLLVLKSSEQQAI